MCFNMVTRNSESNRNLFLYGLMTFRFEISHVRTLTGQYHVTLMLLHVTILKHTIEYRCFRLESLPSIAMDSLFIPPPIRWAYFQ